MKHQRSGKRNARCFAGLIGIIVTVSLVSFAVASGNDSVFLAANAPTTQNGWSLEGSFITYKSLCDLRASNLSPQIVKLAADTKVTMTTLCESLGEELQQPLALMVKVQNSTGTTRTLAMPFPLDVVIRDDSLAKSAFAVYYLWTFKGKYMFRSITFGTLTGRRTCYSSPSWGYDVFPGISLRGDLAFGEIWEYDGEYMITAMQAMSTPKNPCDLATILLKGEGEIEADVKPNTAVEFLYLIPRFSGKATIEFGDLGSFTATSLIDTPGVNDPPVVLDIPDQTIDEGGTLTGISLDDYVSDPDNEDGEIAWTYSGNDQFDVIISDDRTATVTARDPEWNGSETITFTATDPNGLSDSDSATFTVMPVNDPPVVSDIPDEAIQEGSTFTSILLDDYVSDSDNEGAEMAWTYSGNAELSVDISNDRIATITMLDPEWSGSETITFTVTDPGGLSDSDSATFTVIPVNDPPVVSDIPDQTIEVGGTFTGIPLDDYVSDPNDEDAKIAWTYSGNVELSVDISNDRIATITVLDPEWSGSETITFTAADPDGLSDSDSATFTVEVTVVLGDVDNNGEVRSNDAILALRIAAGLMEPDEYQKQAADMNGDSEVRANDAIIILRKAAGLVAPD